ncbi:MAG TPA: matrixin family metalloprotease [bacterium]|nr:matrixin family metalloprotease [bacterium]
MAGETFTPKAGLEEHSPLTFCGLCLEQRTEPLKDRGWGKNHLRWCLLASLPNLAMEAFASVVGQALASWEAVSGLTFERVADSRSADIVLDVGKIDGPRGVLAHSELPPSKPCRQKYDRDEAWGAGIDPVAVVCHELGHALGLYHGKPSGELMSPHYDPAIKAPTPGDVARIQALYGPPRAVPAPPAVPTGGARFIASFDAQGRQLSRYEVVRIA